MSLMALKNFRKISQNSLEIEPPYGTIIRSKFYVERAADDDCWDYINRTPAVTLLFKPLAKWAKFTDAADTLSSRKRMAKPCTFIDFQKFQTAFQR
jgi:hypothetical protein